MIDAWFDGCCEPVNPGGTAAFGSVIFRDGERVWECSRIFKPQKGRERETSNNVAEYSGFISILEWLQEQGLRKERIHIRGDSNLVIQQMRGKWKIRQGHYVPLAIRARDMVEQFPRLTLTWISRDDNDLADELSKRELKRAGVKFMLQPE